MKKGGGNMKTLRDTHKMEAGRVVALEEPVERCAHESLRFVRFMLEAGIPSEQIHICKFCDALYIPENES